MNPTREQFELAARAVGIVRYEHITLSEGGKSALWVPDSIFSSYQSWQPHIPGTDNAMLAAALGEYRTNTTEFGCIVHVGDSYHICEHDAFDGTETERRAKAMAWAVFLVAAEIGRTMKEAGNG